MEELYYLQDTRSLCGNLIFFWAIGGSGYTVEVRAAEVWTKEQLIKLGYWENHEKYKPWPKLRIDSLVQHHVDFQDLEHKDNTGNLHMYSHVLMARRPDLCITTNRN